MTSDIWVNSLSPEDFEKKRRLRRVNSVGESSKTPKWLRSSLQNLEKIFRGCKKLPHSPITWIFLITLGVFSALFACFMEFWIILLSNWREKLAIGDGKSTHFWSGYFLWIVFCVVCSLGATSCSHWISIAADGSGIPQMRSILSGNDSISRTVLSIRTLVAKVLGVILSMGGGLSVGREGPYTEICAIIAHLLSRIGCYNNSADEVNMQYIAAGVAAGVTAVFGTPLGGVLFSIEVTTNFYAVSNLWRGVICSSFCVLTFEVINSMKMSALFPNTTFSGFALGWELLAFLFLGSCCGIAAASFTRTISYMIKKKKEYPKFFESRYTHVFLGAVITGVATFPLHVLRIPDNRMINLMFHNGFDENQDWQQLQLFFTVFGYFTIKFIVTAMMCGAPIPSGVFIPLFTLGAVIGRYYGELLRWIYGSTIIDPASYAVVGAAALSAGATHSVSTAVIVFELTGQLSHMLPVMLSVLVSYSIAGTFSPSIYDILFQAAGLPCIPVAPPKTDVLLRAKDIMQTDFMVLTLNSTYKDMTMMLERIPHHVEKIAVCDTSSSMLLIGAVTKANMRIALSRARDAEISEELDCKSTDDMDSTHMMGVDQSPLIVDEDSSLKITTPRASRSNPNNRNFENWEIEFAPPYGAFTYISLPIDPYPPQVGYLMPMSKIYPLASLCFWTYIYVTKQGKLVGIINSTKYDNSE